MDSLVDRIAMGIIFFLVWVVIMIPISFMVLIAGGIASPGSHGPPTEDEAKRGLVVAASMLFWIVVAGITVAALLIRAVVTGHEF